MVCVLAPNLDGRVNRPMMYYNRKKALAELVFKVLHGLSSPVPQELFIKQITMHDLRDNDMLVQPRFQTMKHGFISIAYQGTIMWNSIPSHIKAIDNYTLFKSALAKWIMKSCNCGSCFICRFKRKCTYFNNYYYYMPVGYLLSYATHCPA